jgi:hypothetical protein
MQNKVKFLLLIIFQIPAIFISIIIFLYFTIDRIARAKPRNHIWLVLLTLNFFYLITDLPLSMSYFYQGKVWPESNAYCIWWAWYEFSLNNTGLYLMAWASIERHLLIFHPQTIMHIQWKKWVFHFIPIALCFIWISTFNFVVIVISPDCINKWNFNDYICGLPCIFTTNSVVYSMISYIVNVVFPLSVITVANIALIIRVIYEKISHHQTVHWRRQRKMASQLWLISSLYLACWLPLTISHLILVTVSPSFLLKQIETTFFLVYFVPLLLPIVCLNTFPELIDKFRQIIRRRMRMNRIGVSIVRNVR